ncbi:MAG: protein kinase [Leptospiraceae bacterium]|nr:protein kinase [Leptospiraceae bacterium]
MLKKALEPKIIVSHKIAEGGMAGIYLGEQISLQRKVVIKILFPGFASNKKLSKKFFEEARIAANLKHINIVEIIDSGEIENRPYFIMEYGEQGSLAEKLESIAKMNNKLSIREACGYVINILAAIEFAQRKKLIAHRDIKPENILIRESGVAFLADFGIALLESEKPVKGETMGSYPYMSPEQTIGDIDIDGRSDIYSCGILLYLMITGELPFQAKDKEEWIELHKNLPVPNINSKLSKKELEELNSSLIEVDTLQSIITKACAKNKKDRYKNPSEMIEAIKKILKRKDSFLNPENIKNRRIAYSLMAFTFFIIIGTGYFFTKLYISKTCLQCCVEGNCKDGIGAFRYENNDFYEGSFAAGRPHGKGTYYYSNNDKYEGDFVEGRLEGTGTYYSHNKDWYIGEFKNGKQNGRGTYNFAIGARYDARFKDGEPYGKGTYYTSVGDRYEGEVKDMIPHGKGILYYKNGNIYTGGFDNGNRHGMGYLVTTDGKRYEGKWVNDKLIKND